MHAVRVWMVLMIWKGGSTACAAPRRRCLSGGTCRHPRKFPRASELRAGICQAASGQKALYGAPAIPPKTRRRGTVGPKVHGPAGDWALTVKAATCDTIQRGNTGFRGNLVADVSLSHLLILGNQRIIVLYSSILTLFISLFFSSSVASSYVFSDFSS